VASRGEEYRRLAQQCLEMARTIGNKDVRATLVQMAQVWQPRRGVHEGASCITPSRPFRFYPKAQIRRRADRASESPAASLSLYHFISHVVLCGMSIAV
jgi:hypothetical protein